MHWSVNIAAEGDRELTREEIVELADAVAPYAGVASGIGTNRYGAQLLVEAESREQAIAAGTEVFAEAVRTARLPGWPVVLVDAFTEGDELDQLG
jgi:hypothetical protein